MNYSLYYQAKVNKEKTWFLVATLKFFEHLTFDRTLDKKRGTIEFFVPKELEVFFINIMKKFQELEIVLELKQMENRLADPNSTL